MRVEVCPIAGARTRCKVQIERLRAEFGRHSQAWTPAYLVVHNTAMRKLSVGLLLTAITAIIIALAISDWRNGLAFGGGSYDKEAMVAVTFLIILGVACLIIVLILDIVMLCQNVIPAGMLTARFIILYLGAALLLTGVLVFTARSGRQWPYFLTIVGTVFAVLVAIIAAISCRCVSNQRVVVVRSTR